ncbi:deoxynucleoside kinase-like isoform X1 [Macrosteles quadrilineatus]|uniref:deoxynucleoside kinase-like isoform X1 n=1 Tax=Macrosteles quadrilineatus TaxID=74068 RepID=UPI0023E3453F|nr:deoxynucleoside kinase-like isoform X1 [Macrosteles quadrilineatus]
MLRSSFKKLVIQSKSCLPSSVTFKKMGADCKSSEAQSEDHSKRPLRVSIEGNIGCGKSTLINYFKKFSEVDSRPEPLDSWKNVQGHNLLMLTYAEPQRWNFTFQHYVQLSRLSLQVLESEHKIQIFERSLQNNRYCFVEMAHKAGLLADPDYVAMCEWYDWIENNLDIGLDLIVYLRSDPVVVYERMQRRGRPEESPVSLQYLTDLHNSYERWLVDCDPSSLPAPVLVVDVNNDLPTVQAMYKTVEQYILGRKAIPNTGYVKEFGWGIDRIEEVTC